jgi:hypothetical protein
MDLLFVAANGQYLNKLNAYQDFLDVHPDVTVPNSRRKQRDTVESDVDVFLEHVAATFGEQ